MVQLWENVKFGKKWFLTFLATDFSFKNFYCSLLLSPFTDRPVNLSICALAEDLFEIIEVLNIVSSFPNEWS